MPRQAVRQARLTPARGVAKAATANPTPRQAVAVHRVPAPNTSARKARHHRAPRRLAPAGADRTVAATTAAARRRAVATIAAVRAEATTVAAALRREAAGATAAAARQVQATAPVAATAEAAAAQALAAVAAQAEAEATARAVDVRAAVEEDNFKAMTII